MNPFNFAPPPPENPNGAVEVENLNGSCVIRVWSSARREHLLIHVYMPWDTAAEIARRILKLYGELETMPEWPREL